MLVYEVIGGVGGIPDAYGFTSAVDGGIWAGFVPVTSRMILTDKLSTLLANGFESLFLFGELPDLQPGYIIFLFHQKHLFLLVYQARE